MLYYIPIINSKVLIKYFKTGQVTMLRIITVTIMLFLSLCGTAFADGTSRVDENAREARLRNKASLVRVAASYGPLLNTAHETLNRNSLGTGGFLDVMFYRHRWQNVYGVDIFLRFHARYFEPTGIDLKNILIKNIPYQNTLILLGGDVAARLAYRFYFFRTLWDVYFMVAPRFVYTRATSEDVYTKRIVNEARFYSFGFISGAGFEVTFFPWLGIFLEYNFGYVPVGESERNIEGHQLYAGVTARVRMRRQRQ